jgi:putative endonuclease
MSRHNITVGRRAEARVAARYEADGYEVVARNWRHGRHGEIDLVLAKRDVLVICEVKARSSERFGTPADAVDWRKQQRLRRLAVAFLAAHEVRPRHVRFDVACVLGDDLTIIDAAF